MDYIFLIILAVVIVVAGYVITSRISYISKYAVVVTLAATIVMGISLLPYTRAIVYTGIPGAAATLAPSEVKSLCGEKDLKNTFCYKQIEYRGLPFKVASVERSADANPKIDLGRNGASAAFIDYFLYLGIFVVIAFGIEKLRRTATLK